MPKFTLICDYSNNLDTHVVRHEFTAEHLYDVLENFQMFLRGAGYVFDGDIDIVTEENIPTLQDEVVHHESYFDIQRNR